MMVRAAIVALAMTAIAAWCGNAAAETRLAATQAALDTNSLPTGLGASTELGAGTSPSVIDAAPEMLRPQALPRRAQEPRGNPLWAVPVKALTTTRERPIFLPSRRPPAPAVAGPPPPEPVRPPPPPVEPERPQLALVGAISGQSEGIAVFLDQTNRDIVRLRTGENHRGWTLRSVRGREVTLQKERESVLLALPAPHETAAAPGFAGIPGFPMPGGPTITVPGRPPISVGPPRGKEPEL